MSETVDPKTIAVLDTYAHFHGIELKMIPSENGVTNLSALSSQLSTQESVAGVIVQQPNRYGIVEDYSGFADAIHEHKALFIVNVYVVKAALRQSLLCLSMSE